VDGAGFPAGAKTDDEAAIGAGLIFEMPGDVGAGKTKECGMLDAGNRRDNLESIGRIFRERPAA
jgi:hypothetical protein